MIGYGREFYFSLFTSRWKKVTGRVVHATVEETIDQYDERRSRFQARADYDYDYLGITRRGQHFLAGNVYDSREEAKARLDAYVVNQEIDVYVYLNRPSKSTLVPGIEYGSLVAFLFGVGVLGLCLHQLQRII